MIVMRIKSEEFLWENAGINEDSGDDSTDADVKQAVRERDGNKCSDCGKTSEQHIEQTGRDLDVHRLIPGHHYHPHNCVLLCRACHGKKPKNVYDALWCTDLRWVMFNLYNPEDAELWEAVKDCAYAAKLTPTGFLRSLLLQAADDRRERLRADALVCNDGLW